MFWFRVRGAIAGKGPGLRRFAYTKDDILDTVAAACTFDVGKEGGFQERKLLEPDRIGNHQMQFVETDLSWPRVRGQGFSYNVAPLTLQAKFKEFGFEAQSLGKSVQDGTAGIERARTRHGFIIADRRPECPMVDRLPAKESGDPRDRLLFPALERS